MSREWDYRSLLEPVAGDNPCGPGVDPAVLLSFDAYRLFGGQIPLDSPLEPGETGRVPLAVNAPEWVDIRNRALGALDSTKDLRLLPVLGAALLRTDGVEAFCRVVLVASHWLTEYWEQVHPPAVEDAIERQNALSCFADPFAVVDALRRTPIVSSRQHGHVTLRDLDQGANEAQVTAAFDDVPLDELKRLRQAVADAASALPAIEARLKAGDPEAIPIFERFTPQLVKLERLVRGHLGRREGVGDSAADGALETGGRAAERAPAGVGAIRSREDAIRALDAVSAFFSQSEPSSPIPLLLDRAKRLVSKSFLEVLADIAPGALGEARTASGVRNE